MFNMCVVVCFLSGQGADVIPLYFFGNTSVLSTLKSAFLESISRKYQISLTWFWGVAYLPIPRPNKVPHFCTLVTRLMVSC